MDMKIHKDPGKRMEVPGSLRNLKNLKKSPKTLEIPRIM